MLVFKGPTQTSYLVTTGTVTLPVKGLGHESDHCSAKVLRVN